jgi:hypothetical protein
MRMPSALEILLLIAVGLIVFGLVGMARGEDQGEIKGQLWAFCDTEWAEVCNQDALMLKDVCEATVQMYDDGSDRFSCAVVDDATRDAYLAKVEPDVREKTIKAWREGR